MANTPIVADSNNPAYDSFLSTTNGFYAAEAWNLGIASTTQLAISTPRYINITPAHTGKAKGIVLGMYGASASTAAYGAEARLEEYATVTISIASPGVVTWNTHGFSGGEEISFTTTGALPTGLTAGTRYFVKYVDGNTFNVSATSGGSNINTSGTQSGTHSCGVMRASKGLTSAEMNSEYILGSAMGTSGTNYCGFLVPFKFTSTYAVDTTASKWRIRVAADTTVGSSNVWSLLTSDATNPSFVFWCDNQATATDGDILIIADKIYIDKSFTTGGAVGTGEAVLGYAGWICRSTDITRRGVCLLEWHPTPAASYTLTLKNRIALGKFAGMRIGTGIQFTGALAAGAESATLDTAWTWSSGTYQVIFTEVAENDTATVQNRKWVTFTNGSTAVTWTGGLAVAMTAVANVGISNSKQAIITTSTKVAGTSTVSGFIYLAGDTSSRSRAYCSFFAYGEMPDKPYGILSQDEAISQAHIHTTEDLSSYWQANDYVYVGKQDISGQGTTAWQQISSISGTDITLTGNLLTNARKAGGTIINRDRGWGVNIKGETNANYLIAPLAVPQYFEVSGCKIEDTLISLFPYGSYYQYPVLASNRGKYIFEDNLVVFSGASIAGLFSTAIVPPEGFSFRRNIGFRVGLIYTTTALQSKTVVAIPYISGYIKFRRNRTLAQYSSGAFYSSSSILKQEIEDNTFENAGSSMSFAFICGLNPTFKRNVVWGNATVVTIISGYGGIGISSCVNARLEDNYFDKNYTAITFVQAATILGFQSQDDVFGSIAANTQDIAYQSIGYQDIQFNSPTGTLTYDETNNIYIDAVQGSRLKIVDENNASNVDKVIDANGRFQRCGDGLTDTTVHTSGSGKFSLRFEPFNDPTPLEWRQSIPTGNIQNLTMVVSVWVKLNSANYYGGSSYQMPRLNVNYDNGTIAYAEATATTDWQLLTVSFTPTTTYGLVQVYVDGSTDATTTDAYFYVDDMSVFLPPGVQLALGGMDLFANAMPITPSISTNVTAADVWAVQTSTLTSTGSIGKYAATTLESNIRGADNDDLKDISDEIATITVDNAAIADAVLDEILYEHTKANSVGEKFNNFNAGISFDYQAIRKIVEQEINKISDSLPKSEKVDLSEIVKKLDNAQEAIEEKLNKKDINITYDIANSIKEWEKTSKEIRDKSVENLRKTLEREAVISGETIIEKTEKRANELSNILSDTTKTAKEQLSGFDQAIKEVVDREMIKFTEQIKETVDKLIEQISKPITLNYAIEEDEEETDNKENRINNMMKYV